MLQNKTLRLLFSSLAFSAVLIGLSFIINHVILGPAHEKYDFFRPEDDARVMPGLMLTTLLWGFLVTVGYRAFGGSLKAPAGFKRGSVYGLVVFCLFVAVQEIYYYQFIKFEADILASALVHYLLTFTIGGGLIGWIESE